SIFTPKPRVRRWRSAISPMVAPRRCSEPIVTCRPPMRRSCPAAPCQTDAGMCGDYDSVIGMQKEPATRRFVSKMPGERPQPAEGEATLCGILLETDDRTGLARAVEPVRIGGRLVAHLPQR